jgi:C-terminal processing protease CtpA/Prc
LDTGAALPLLLFSNTNSKIQVPEKVIAGNIGMGLGGYLEGFIGRIQGLAIGNVQQKYILTYFQKIDTAQDLTYLNNRNGLVGNRLLNRFQVVIDYDRGYLWLKASKNYRQRYVFDRSGLSIIAGGVTLNQFTVQVVVPGTPAAAAGLLPGDRILRIGGMPAVMLGLPDVQRRLQKKVGKKITLVVLREGKKIKKSFRLRELV